MKAHTLLSRVVNTLRPPENLSLSEWYQKNIVFSAAASRKAGRWDPTFAPFQRSIMDACTDPRYERIVVIKSGQSGITTTVLAGMMLYSIFQEPTHILYVRPSDEDVQKFSKKELKNLLDGSPNLRGFFKESKGKEQSNNIKLKLFPGGSLTMIGSGSAGALAGFSAKIVLIDEVDKMKPVPGVGNVLDLAETRSKTFTGYGRKLIYVSTPELAGSENTVGDLYSTKSDMRKWFSPCPYCGEYQTIEWANVKYSHCKETLDDIYIECIACKGHISELQRMPMVRKGEWRVTNHSPERAGFPGFSFNDLISPLSGGLVAIVREWLDIGMDQLKLKNFINERLGQPWEEKAPNQISSNSIFNRRERYSYPIPYGVGMLTMGVDVQDDRLEYSVWGWGKDDESWLIRHGIILESPGLARAWETLESVIYSDYAHESGASIPLDRVCVDTGGHFTSQVYNFVHKRWPQIVPIKGSSVLGAPMTPARGAPAGPRNILRYDLGVDSIKDQLFSYLQIDTEGPGYVHFPEHAISINPEYDEEYFKQIVAEVPAYHYVSGQKTKYYKQIRRNEALDCWVYAYGGFKMANYSNILPTRLQELRYRGPVQAEVAQPITPPRQVVTPQQQPRTAKYKIQNSGSWR